jgi:SAM-dependent methyltransferase
VTQSALRSSTEAAVRGHYECFDLLERALAALRAVGKDPEALTVDDLGPMDNFHTRGKDATLDLARLAEVSAGLRVLDVGGGLGGPARLLASTFGCEVTVLDLTEEFVRVGEDLTRRTGLQDRVRFHVGSALDMPFESGSFDLALTQHVSMNIPDKRGLYGEARRVLKPGGRLALHEVVAGPASPIHLPVPWAREPGGSFLVPQAELRALLRGLGYAELVWSEETGRARSWFAARAAQRRPEAGPPPLGLHLLLGSHFSQMFANQARNLAEGRVEIVQALFERAA